MQRNRQFLRYEDEIDEDKTILLDIDGVFKVELAQDHFDHDWDKTREYINKNYPKYNYDDITPADLNATYYTFKMDSVGIFKKLVEDTHAKVVISSDWRTTKSLYQLKALFHLHDMDMYITDKILGDALKVYYINKEEALDEYLQRVNPKKYVIIDDYNYYKKYKLNFTRVKDLFSLRDYYYSKIILSNNNYTINRSYDLIDCKSNNYTKTMFKCEDYLFDNYKVKYLQSYKLDKHYDYKEYIEYFLNKMSFEDDSDFIIYDSEFDDLGINASYDTYGIYTFNISNKSRDELNFVKRKILSKKR